MKLEDLKRELDDEKCLTENGAVGYRTTGKNLLDINFMASSLRRMSEDEIYNRFVKAFYEDKLLATKWLLFLRDCRGGMGERRSFRVILQKLAEDQPDLVKKLIPIVAEYGRWDDLLCLLDTNLRDFVGKHFYLQIINDMENMKINKPISLLGKWLPSYNGKNDKYARILASKFNMGKKSYRKLLKAFRRYSNVLECKMSDNNWNEINYSAVPSKANLLYKNAFMKHDEERRKAYLESLAKGEAKINAGVLFVHDIVHKYTDTYGWNLKAKSYDATNEGLWKSLSELSEIEEETIVVRDDSGSMETTIDYNSKVTALEVATALAIYFSQCLKRDFKDKYISFSSRPKFIDLSNCASLKEKLDVSYAHSEVSNTNIKATFDLILNTAVKNNYTQDELPKNVLIISDMEFDRSCTSNPNETLFEEIARDYAKHGYKLPRLIFWNLCSRTGTIPVKQNETGVALISGFSQNILNMVLKGNLDPYNNLVEVLNTERYDAVEEAFNNSLIKTEEEL